MDEKILLLTHGGWGKYLLKSIEMILGRVSFVDEIGLEASYLMDEYRTYVEDYIKAEHEKASALQKKLNITIFTDMFGGTPTNVAALVSKEHDMQIHVITGLNAPLLLEACSQISFHSSLNYEELLKNTKETVFDVMEKICKKG